MAPSHGHTPIDVGAADGKYLDSTQRTLTEQGVAAGSRVVPAGSLVLSTRAPIGYVAETAAGMAFNQGCRGLVPAVGADVRYFRYQLLALRSDLVSRGAGSTFMELSGDALGAVPVIQPPLDEQRRIADFLDAETTRIDDLMWLRSQQVEKRAEGLLCEAGLSAATSGDGCSFDDSLSLCRPVRPPQRFCVLWTRKTCLGIRRLPSGERSILAMPIRALALKTFQGFLDSKRGAS